MQFQSSAVHQKAPLAERNQIRLITFYKSEKQVCNSTRKGICEKQMTRETLLNKTSRSSSCSSHAHSDGGLHALCRHKRCTNRRQSGLTARAGNVASFQEIDILRRQDIDSSPNKRSEPISDDEHDHLIEHNFTHIEQPVLKITLQL